MVPSIICLKNFTRVKKNYDLSAPDFKLSFKKILWFLSRILNLSCFACDCMKTSTKYVVAFLLKKSGLKFLLLKAEKAAGPEDML